MSDVRGKMEGLTRVKYKKKCPGKSGFEIVKIYDLLGDILFKTLQEHGMITNVEVE